MLSSHFPVTGAIRRDADIILTALNNRAEVIKIHVQNQGIFKKATIAAIKILGIAAAILTIATIPAAAILLNATPLTIGAVSLTIAISSLALYILTEPRSPGELIVKEHWKHLFEALRLGEGHNIIKNCQELFKQKDQRKSHFIRCLGTLPPEDVDAFFHKASLIGHLQISLNHLRCGEIEQAKSRAHLALSHFEMSHFPVIIRQFALMITDNPHEMQQFIQKNHASQHLHSLDFYIKTIFNTSKNR